MRFGLVVDTLPAANTLDTMTALAARAESVGFDLVWLAEGGPGLSSPAVCASALAPRTSTIHVAMSVQAGVNPVYLAEEAAVADLCLGGRLVVALGADSEPLLAETVDVMLAGVAARPFRHTGEYFRIPASLPGNDINRAERLRITPATASLEVPIWLTGPHAAEVGAQRCLTFVGSGQETTETMADRWRGVEARLGLAARRLRRVAVRDVTSDSDGRVDIETLAGTLRADQRSWGLDIALLRLPDASLELHLATLDELAMKVLPRVQLDQLPDGLETYWNQQQEAAT
ncbi:MAG: LLM class flavin-dependent oxidoreductase [Nostocoides sp.]